MFKCLNDKGFTLIEVIVVIFVITIGLLAAFNIIQDITVHSRVAASRLTAVYLAQEGVEIIRNARDSRWLVEIGAGTGHNWDDNKVNLSLVAVAESGLVLNRFTRNINIDDQGNHIVVSSEVEWHERGTTHSVTSTTELYNWIEPPPSP